MRRFAPVEVPLVDLTLDEDSQMMKKRPRKNDREASAEAPAWQPFYLTSVPSVEDSSCNDHSLSFADIMATEEGNPLEEACLMNYMVDLRWIASAAPHLLDLPTTVLHGSQVDPSFHSEKWVVSKVDMGPERFGTHHSKMALLRYRRGLRVVISTANFIPEDFTFRTQASYVQDFPLKEPATPLDTAPLSDISSGSLGADFERDLVAYLLRISVSGRAQQRLQQLIEKLPSFDFSSAEVILVASVPGRHSGSQRDRWGLGRLCRELDRYTLRGDAVRDHALVLQCSSLGSMGRDAMLLHDYAARLLGRAPSADALCFRLVWPTVECVRRSWQGYVSGGSLPCARRTLRGDDGRLLSGFQGRLARWEGVAGRARATPHMKCYFSHRGHSLAWFWLTSANLSQAAMGVFQIRDSQLYVKSYEMGVLFVPRCLRTAGRAFSCTPHHRLLGVTPVLRGSGAVLEAAAAGGAAALVDGVLRIPVAVPFTLPAPLYGPDDQPWAWDQPFELPDCLGRTRELGRTT